MGGMKNSKSEIDYSNYSSEEDSYRYENKAVDISKNHIKLQKVFTDQKKKSIKCRGEPQKENVKEDTKQPEQVLALEED